MSFKERPIRNGYVLFTRAGTPGYGAALDEPPKIVKARVNGTLPFRKVHMKLTVKIQPNAKKSEIVGYEGDVLKVRIKAPPVEGKANEELIRFLSKEWKIPKSAIEILKGHSSKLKLIELPASRSIIFNS